MITFVTFLCDRISYKNAFKSPSIQFIPLMFVNVDIGDTSKDPRREF